MRTATARTRLYGVVVIARRENQNVRKRGQQDYQAEEHNQRPVALFGITPQKEKHVRVHQHDLDDAAHSLSNRPRQILGWLSPCQKPAETLQ